MITILNNPRVAQSGANKVLIHTYKLTAAELAEVARSGVLHVITNTARSWAHPAVGATENVGAGVMLWMSGEWRTVRDEKTGAILERLMPVVLGDGYGAAKVISEERLRELVPDLIRMIDEREEMERCRGAGGVAEWVKGEAIPGSLEIRAVLDKDTAIQLMYF